MSKPYRGGCACGALRYEVGGEPVAMVECQCRQCQRDSGTGHASNLAFMGAQVTIDGPRNTWDMVGDGGTRKSRAFCPTCGSPVYTVFPDMPNFIAVRAASLDEPERYAPQIVVWADAAQPWDRVDEALTKFDQMPPAMA
ncbi:GFA family protein [Rhizobium sp. RU36D]|uniref:GFA family protein n=1 Tax=Rhizobium sp. RU36D TaxID=1907415 RepID=UPI0009D88C5D|nr:GFA family protein [Rhizobium sp. RU36D]SMD14054.1 Uncharacterized conserved protein [Rhizobium sp. RU36D]